MREERKQHAENGTSGRFGERGGAGGAKSSFGSMSINERKAGGRGRGKAKELGSEEFGREGGGIEHHKIAESKPLTLAILLEQPIHAVCVAAEYDGAKDHALDGL